MHSASTSSPHSTTSSSHNGMAAPLSDALAVVRASLSRLAYACHQHRTSRPSIIEKRLAARAALLDELRAALEATEQKRSDAEMEWSKDGPSLSAALNQLQTDLTALIEEHTQLQQKHEEVQRKMDEWETEERRVESRRASASAAAIAAAAAEAVASSSTAAADSDAGPALSAVVPPLSRSAPPIDIISRLPAPLVVHVHRFLDRRSLASCIRVSSSWHGVWDRGLFWHDVCITLVRQIVTEQAKAAAEDARRRRVRNGLETNFQNENFLATIMDRTEKQGNVNRNISSNEEASWPTRPPSFRVTLSIQAKPSDLKKKSSTTGPGGVNNAGGGTFTPDGLLPKARLYARALDAMQSQLTPLLTEFEDLGVKLGAHQRITSFLREQIETKRHELGLARVRFGSLRDESLRKVQQKDDLARSIQEVERLIQQEKKQQADIEEEERKEEEARAQQNRKQTRVDALGQEHIGGDTSSVEPSPPTSLSTTPPIGSTVSNGSDPSILMDVDLEQHQQYQSLLESIRTLKQAKKVLIRGLKDIQADLDATKTEKERVCKQLAQLDTMVQGMVMPLDESDHA